MTSPSQFRLGWRAVLADTVRAAATAARRPPAGMLRAEACK